MAFLTRSFTYLLVLACLIGLFEFAWAESSLRGARVVWVRGDRVYVASPDSVAPGMVLTFKDRGKKVAAAEVTAVQDREMIAATLTSGSLAKVKRLERLEITASPPELHAPPILRIGYPAAGRKNLLIDCTNQSLNASILLGAYKSEAVGGRAFRLVRDSTYSVAAAWPDTLLVRLYDEIADEEIALERGDLDAAVFWPGEASAHIREVMGWRERPSGLRAEGFLAASAWVPGVAADSAWLRMNEWQALALLNWELFRGDLPPRAHGRMPAPASSATRFEADRSFPGRESIQQCLNRALGSGANAGSVRVVRLLWHNPPADEINQGLPPTWVLEIRCPVISAPKLRPYLEAIGIDPLVNLFQCLPPPPKQ